MDRVSRSISHISNRMAVHGNIANDSEVIRRLKSADEAMLELVMNHYSTHLLSVALGVLRQRLDAEEVVQDVFLCLWRWPERFDGARAPLLTWLVVLTRSRALDRLRHLLASNPRETELTSRVIGTAPPLVQAPGFDREILIREALSRLPPEQGTVINKAYFEGYALAEIAGLNKTPVGTIKGRARFALKKLRFELQTSKKARPSREV
jgi:RNA polymerase sigma-70 factor (ECF subfamily)